jgi:cell division septation protein DedD
MERRTTNRILGALVVIGLVIILLPLFQNGNELSTETTLITTPPFPDQPAQVETTMTEPTPQASVIVKPTTSDLQKPVVENEAITAANNDVQIELPHNEMLTSESTVNKAQFPETSAAIHLDPVKIINKTTETSSVVKKTSSKSPSLTALKLTRSPIEDNAQMKLNSAVWVLQIGSFKNKSNALRIVNQLRANGYKAFIQKMSTALGEQTRVFVGPEYKRSNARALADRLRSEMHIQAIVVSYKPLTL